MVDICGYVNDNATKTFEKARKIKLPIEVNNNLELKKEIKKITVELCIKCEDIIEAFYQCEDIIVLSYSKDEIAKELLYRALIDSKEEFLKEAEEKKEKGVSYYKKTIEELTTIIEELNHENKELVAENKELIKKIKKMEEERTQIFEWLKGSPVKSANENVIKKLSDMELLSGKKGVYTLINKIENEKKAEIENSVEDKQKEENQINPDLKEREEK